MYSLNVRRLASGYVFEDHLESGSELMLYA